MRTAPVTIERVEPRRAADGLFDDFAGAHNQVRAEAMPEDPPVPTPALAARCRAMPDDLRLHWWLVRDPDGTVVACSQAWTDLSENLHLLQLDIEVLAGWRRQGLATRLLAEAVDFSRSEGRTRIIGSTEERLPAGAAFCLRLGAERALDMHCNRLELGRVDRAMIRSWIAEAEISAADYELVAIDGAAPDDLLAPVAELYAVMNDAPRGSLDFEDEHMTPEQLRQGTAMATADGTELWLLLARHRPSGRLAGLTAVEWSPHAPQTVAQGDTGVRPEHRGRGLGKWLKAVMLERILTERPGAVDVRTWNADSNQAMLAINLRLGFAPFVATTNWQITVEQGAAWLAERGVGPGG
ncbi:MAG TPA: GNAT family N-acetyltransferase [Acidimicrobiales bacterium]|nr:GNAT family N-acetyltransferase [Acidimicrobiales bacterium]